MTRRNNPPRGTPLSGVLGLFVFLTLSLALSGCVSTAAPIIINAPHTVSNAGLALQDLEARRDTRGRWTDVIVKGTALNTTQKTIQTQALKVTLRDQQGRELVTQTGHIPQPEVATLEKTPFLFTFNNPPASVYAAQIDFFEIGAGLEVQNVSIRRSGTDARQGVTVTGDIVNTTAIPIKMPSLLVGITNRAGDMIRHRVMQSNWPWLSPGETVSFTVAFEEQAEVLYPLSISFISEDEVKYLNQAYGPRP